MTTLRIRPIRPDELAQILHHITTQRPDLALLDWPQLAPRLEHTIALASWRTQTPKTRANALLDAADALSLHAS